MMRADAQIRRDATIHHLLTDSRRLSDAEHTLFFALRGERHDGHRYLADLHRQGLRNFVVEEIPAELRDANDTNFLIVDNTLDALQRLAAMHRRQFTYPVIAITGSNGKTIVKEWLYQLLRDTYHIVRSPKSYNSQTGVPLSVWPMSEQHDLAIFEAGISQPGEMEKLETILRPDIGLLTNIGTAHDENFESRDQKIREKLKLFVHCKTLITNAAIPGLEEALDAPEFANVKRLTWSYEPQSSADVRILERLVYDGETSLQVTYEDRLLQFKIPFTDVASVENAMLCCSLLLHLGLSDEEIALRMHTLAPVAMRLELKDGINDCSLINDAYNSDLGSLSIAIDFLNQQNQHPKRTLILSDILQSGRSEQNLYHIVALMVERMRIQRFIGIGEALERNKEAFSIADKIFFPDTAAFLQALPQIDFRNETILIKGARAFGFEAIVNALQEKAHETVLAINLNALVHNLNYFRSRLLPATKIMAMVKAFSYGSGTFEIANVLHFHRVDYLAVAYADEGVALRRTGIRTPIMVMNPEEQGYEAMIAHRLEPEIFSFRVLERFVEALHVFGNGEPFPVHLKLDTGMHRLGFEAAAIDDLIGTLKEQPLLHVQSIFSHLAASDEGEHDAFTREQVAAFTKMSDKIMAALGRPVMRHILNSAGIQRFPEAQFDMVRLGIGLYGVGASEKEQAQLQHVSTLKTVISQIKHIPAGETVGYSRKGKAVGDIAIATVPIGYADGLSRRLSNGKGKMWINGKAAPIIGNVCMDMTMLDITNIDCREGDEVIIFNEDHSIAELAHDMDTIAYEVLTMVSGRVKRVYYQE